MTALLTAVLLLAGCGKPAPESSADVVQTTAGPVRGQVAPALRIFEGIPYAAAPVGPCAGSRRWHPSRGGLHAMPPNLVCGASRDVRADPGFRSANQRGLSESNRLGSGGATPKTPPGR